MAQSEVPPEWPLRLRQLDASGRSAVGAAVAVLFGGDDAAADGGFPFVQVVVPEEGLGSVALVGRDGVVIAQRTVSAGRSGGVRRVRNSMETGVRCTFAGKHRTRMERPHVCGPVQPDDGVQWQLSRPAGGGDGLTVPLDGLPGGARCRIRVTANDGIRTALAGRHRLNFRIGHPGPITGILSGETVPFGDREVVGVVWRWTAKTACSKRPPCAGPWKVPSGGRVGRWVRSGASTRRYSVSVSALDSGGVSGRIWSPFTVGPMTIPDASVPPLLDGFANDRGLPERRDPAGEIGGGSLERGTVGAVRGSLYVGFADLPFAAAGRRRPRWALF